MYLLVIETLDSIVVPNHAAHLIALPQGKVVLVTQKVCKIFIGRGRVTDSSVPCLAEFFNDFVENLFRCLDGVFYPAHVKLIYD